MSVEMFCNRCGTSVLDPERVTQDHGEPGLVAMCTYPEDGNDVWTLCGECMIVVRAIIEGPSLAFTLTEFDGESGKVFQSGVDISPEMAQEMLQSGLADPAEYRIRETIHQHHMERS